MQNATKQAANANNPKVLRPKFGMTAQQMLAALNANRVESTSMPAANDASNDPQPFIASELVEGLFAVPIQDLAQAVGMLPEARDKQALYAECGGYFAALADECFKHQSQLEKAVADEAFDKELFEGLANRTLTPKDVARLYNEREAASSNAASPSKASKSTGTNKYLWVLNPKAKGVTAKDPQSYERLPARQKGKYRRVYASQQSTPKKP